MKHKLRLTRGIIDNSGVLSLIKSFWFLIDLYEICNYVRPSQDPTYVFILVTLS